MTTNIEEEDPKKDVVMNDLDGEVLKAKRFGIYVAFMHEGKSQIAVMFPGKSYINGIQHFLDVCKTDQELSLLLPKGQKVKVSVEIQTAKAIVVAEEEYGNGHRNGPRRCGWHVTELWVNGSKADFNEEKADEGFKAKMQWVGQNVLKTTNVKAEPATWFAKSIKMVNSVLPHPSKATFKAQKGQVIEVHRPDGGLIKVDNQMVYFHRSRVFLNGDHLSATLDLDQYVRQGQEVTVDFIEKTDDLFDDIEAATHVALCVYTGSEPPQIPDVVIRDFSLDLKDTRPKYFIAKITKFDDPNPESGMVESGLAEIQMPTDQNTLAFEKKTYKKYLDLTKTKAVQKVSFHRSNMIFLGSALAFTDLRYFFSADSFGLDTFYCYVEPLEEEPKLDGGVTHKVTLGWKSSTKFLHATGQGSLALTANSPEDSLLFPRLYTFPSSKFMAKEGFDVETYENILEGALGPRSDYFNDNDGLEGQGWAFARVNDLYPAVSNGVNACIAHIETGEFAGERAFVDRNVSSAFGWKLNKVDLQYLLDMNEPIFIKVTKSDRKEHHVKLRATEMWIGWPHSAAPATSNDLNNLDHIPEDKRYKVLLYLESHSMTVDDFLKIVTAAKKPRTFLPFRKDENKGTIVQLDRSQQSRSNSTNNANSSGSVSGVIKVDRGPLAGKLVAFHRRNSWVLGYNMALADLTHIFIEGQKVSVEAILSKGEDRKSPKREQSFTHRATLVWTSKFRPRNDIEKTVPESMHVNNWLKKRNLSWEKFQMMIKGNLPCVDSVVATSHKSNMLRGNELNTIQTLQSQPPLLAPAPVFRHGHEAARICDMALAVTGPNDSRLGNLIQNDANAQMAFHMHKALEASLEIYKKKTGRETLNGTSVMNESIFVTQQAQVQPLMQPFGPVVQQQPQQQQQQQWPPQQSPRPQWGNNKTLKRSSGSTNNGGGGQNKRGRYARNGGGRGGRR